MPTNFIPNAPGLTVVLPYLPQTNNPRKMSVLRALGVEVTDRVPCIVEAQEFSETYLAVKAARMNHVLEGEFCYWNHDGEPMPPTRTNGANGANGILTGSVADE